MSVSTCIRIWVARDNGQEELKNKSCVNDVTLRARQAFRASVAFLLPFSRLFVYTR